MFADVVWLQCVSLASGGQTALSPVTAGMGTGAVMRCQVCVTVRLASPDRAVTRVSAYTLLAVCTVTSLFIIA